MPPPNLDFETQTWKKVVDVDIVDVVELRQHQYF